MRTRKSETPKAGAANKTPPPKKGSPATAGQTPESAPAAKATPKSAKAARGAANAAKQSTPKSAATSKSPATPVPDLEQESTVVEEVAIPSAEKTPAACTKSPMKRQAKGKSPLSSAAKAAAASTKKAVKSKETELKAEVAKLKMEEAKMLLEQVRVEAEKAMAGTEEVNVESEEVKEEIEVGPADIEEVEHDVGEKVGERTEEDATEVQKPLTIVDTKGKMVDVPIKDNEDYMEQDKIPEDGDHDMAGHDDFQVPGDKDFVEEEEEMGGEDIGGEEAGGEEEVALEEEVQNEISDMARRRKLKKEQEIFVGGLDRDAVEEDVKKAFEKIGEVVEVRLHKDFVTNKNKGFAFVKFADKEQASKALAEAKNPVIQGKRCGIAPSEDNDTLFLGNICNTWTKEAIKRKLKDYGVEAFENITLVGDTQNEGLSRGFAFIEFSCHADAMLAYKRLQKPDVIFGHPERTAKVAFAEPLREPDAEVMAQVKSVFVDGLPPYWDEDRVKKQFKEYGEIERVVLARNMPSAKRKDFGFVNFKTHGSAIACIAAVNNTELGDGKSKVKVRARLSNPLPKTQAVKGGMCGGFRIGHSGAGGFPRFGRGFGRGRFPFNRAGFLGGRGFHPRGRGRGGGFLFSNNDLGRPFRGRGMHAGGRRGSFRNTFADPIEEFGPRFSSSARRGAFDGRLGNPFLHRRQPFPFGGDFGGPFDRRQFGEDPYLYGDVGHGSKRPFSAMEHDPSYLESVSRQRPRYDQLSGGVHYRDTLGPAGGFYSDYYGPDFGDGGYSYQYGDERPGGGYYY